MDATMTGPGDDSSSPIADGGTAPGNDGGMGTPDTGMPGMDSGSSACPAGETMCTTGCVNEQTDQNNCGGCGLACAIPCAKGHCVIALAKNQPTGQGFLAVDLVNVYWGTYGSNSVLSVPIKGGNVTPIATGQNIPWGVATNGTLVFWANSAGGGGQTAINASITPPLTPSVDPLATGFAGNPGPIAVYEDYVYFTDVNGGSTYVMKANTGTTNGSAITITPGTTEMFGCAADKDSVYWTNYGGGTAQKTGHDGGVLSTIGKGMSLPMQITVDTNNAYVATQAGIASMPLNGNGDLTTLITQAPTVNVAVDSQYVYWTNGSCPDGGTCPTVQKAPLDGGAPITIADGPGGQGIAVDQTSAYYTSDGGIVKVTPK
jgi:hypothetical protein